jgi:hypothetical protein
MRYHEFFPHWQVFYVDTLLMAQYLWHEKGCSGKRHGLGLDALGETLFGIGKMEGFELQVGRCPEGVCMLDGDEEYLKQLAAYNVIDTKITWKLFCYLIDRIPPDHMYTIHWAVKQFVEPTLKLNKQGIVAHRTASEEARQELIDKVPGASLSILRSRGKCLELFESHGIDVPMKMSPTTKKLIPQLAKGDNFIVKFQHEKSLRGDIIRARLAAQSAIEITRANTMLQAATHSDNYRFHIAPSGAFTHRPAGRDGGGGNPLNLQRTSKLRRSIEAPPGKMLLVFDYSKMELMLARWGAVDKPAKHKLSIGEDMYTSFIANVLQVDPTDVTEGQRFVGKTSQLSLQYSVGAEAFCKAINASGKYSMTPDEAQKIVNYFRYTAHPRIPEAWNQCGAMLRSKLSDRIAFFRSAEWDLKFPGGPTKSGWQWPGSGRIIRFPEIREVLATNVRGRETVYNPMYPINPTATRRIYPGAYFQALCQSCANEVIDHCRAGLARLDLQVVSECYDELTLIIDPVDEQDAIAAVTQVATTCHLDWWGDDPPPLKVDIGTGDNYYDAKP